MPRKRKTRTPVSTRPKVQAPEGDEGMALSLQERREKLKVLKSDFMNQLHGRLEQMRQQAKNVISRVESMYTMELLKLPKNVKCMTMGEFYDHGGVIDTSSVEESRLIVSDICNITVKVDSILNSTSGGRGMDTIQEEGEGDENIKPKTTRGKGRTAKMPPPSTAATRRTSSRTNKMFTPVGGGQSRSGWETPLVTPKFDPRLPNTPASSCRPKRKQEKVIRWAVSSAGSPLQCSKQDNFEAAIETALEDAAGVNADCLDEQTARRIELLHRTLGKMMRFDSMQK